jgi:hypothetical protein
MDNEEKRELRLELFEVLGEVFVELANTLTLTPMDYNRRSTRLFIEIYDFLSEIHIHLELFLLHVENFRQEERVGWKVHWIYEAGKNLIDFQNFLNQTTKWIDVCVNGNHKIKVWTPSIQQKWDNVNNMDYGYSAGEEAIANWKMIIDCFREQLQATNSPNPDLFPTTNALDEISQRMQNLRLRSAIAAQTIRAFTTTHLKVSDFF